MPDILSDFAKLFSESFVFFIVCAAVSAGLYLLILLIIFKHLPEAFRYKKNLLICGFVTAFVFGFVSICSAFFTLAAKGFAVVVCYLIEAAVLTLLVFLESLVASHWIGKKLKKYFTLQAVTLFIFTIAFDKVVIVLIALYAIYFVKLPPITLPFTV